MEDLVAEGRSVTVSPDPSGFAAPTDDMGAAGSPSHIEDSEDVEEATLADAGVRTDDVIPSEESPSVDDADADIVTDVVAEEMPEESPSVDVEEAGAAPKYEPCGTEETEEESYAEGLAVDFNVAELYRPLTDAKSEQEVFRMGIGPSGSDIVLQGASFILHSSDPLFEPRPVPPMSMTYQVVTYYGGSSRAFSTASLESICEMAQLDGAVGRTWKIGLGFTAFVPESKWSGVSFPTGGASVTFNWDFDGVPVSSDVITTTLTGLIADVGRIEVPPTDSTYTATMP